MTRIFPFAIAVIAVLVACVLLRMPSRDDDAVVYAPSDTAFASWRYTQMPMVECAWCGSKVSLQRHHVIPWSAMPELENEPTNIVVLCQPDHFRVAHGGNWKRFNSNLMATLSTPVWTTSNDYYREQHGGEDRTEKRR